MTHQLTYKNAPVPWVTMWSAEQEAIDARPYECVRPYLMNGQTFNCVTEPRGLQGEGEPEFARVATSRAHKSATRGLCQVCGKKPLDKHQQQFWSVPTAGHAHQFAVGLTFYGAELPVCPQCAGIAARHCPHLIHSTSADRLWVMGTMEDVVGGVIAPQPAERQSVFATLDKITSDWVVKQWVIRVRIEQIIGDNAALVRMQEGVQ